MNCLRCNSPAISDTSSESPTAEDYSLTFTAEEGKIKYMSHPTCEVACTACHQPLDQGSKCWIHHEDSRVYCYDCYSYRTTQKICNICNDVIENLEYATMVSKDCHIHTNCLACVVCFKPWSKGQRMNFKMESQQIQIFCEEHSNIVTSPSIEESEKEPSNIELVEPKEESADSEEQNEDDDKKKRTPRTKFTDKQTALMMNIFASTPRPTRLMREQMAKETGLPIRCIQIWFQNKRSKEKRQSAKRSFNNTHQSSWYIPYGQQTGLGSIPGAVYRAPPSVSPPQQDRYPSPPYSDCGSDYVYQPVSTLPTSNFDMPFVNLEVSPQITSQPCYPSPPY